MTTSLDDEYSDHCVHELVERTARRSPDAEAVWCGADRLTYRDLNERANRLAARLRHLGVGPEAIVAVCDDRSPLSIVAMLAALKAGGAYLPLDPSYPSDRLAFMIKDAAATVLVTTRSVLERLPSASTPVILLDGLTQPASAALAPTVHVDLDNLAYVIYTSGSTGGPKAVMVSHRSLRNLIAWHQGRYRLGSTDRMTHLASVGFDASVWEIWPTLVAGAALVLPDTALAVDDILPFLRDRGITISFLVTPIVNALVTSMRTELEGASVRTVLTGGDTLQVPTTDLPCNVINHYGPTECTVVATAQTDADDASIGRPILNTHGYVLDEDLQPVAAAEPGVLFVAGHGVARGYLRRPGLTAEQFVPNPFGPAGSRMYRTGDRVRTGPRGTFVFMGRTDSQAKIRGYRIEPGDVESALLLHPQVRSAAVTIEAHGLGEKQITAHIVARGVLRGEMELRDHLINILPEYMVPATIRFLSELPTTPNGKIDRKALAGCPARQDMSTYIAPRSATEERLASIWAAVLGRDLVGVTDNFYGLGGDSLRAVQIVARARRAGFQFSVSDLWRAQTIASLATVEDAAATHAGAGQRQPSPRIPTGSGDAVTVPN